MTQPFPEFLTNRFRMRRIKPSDIDRVYAGLSDAQVVAHYGVSYDSLDATQEQMRWFDQLLDNKSGIWWGLARLEDDLLMGACGFNDWSHEHRQVHLGYWLLPEYWRQGLLREGLPFILRHAFQHMAVHRIHADVEPENIASGALLRHLGFVHEGTLRDVECKDGKFLSLEQYGLVSSDPAAIALTRQ